MLNKTKNREPLFHIAKRAEIPVWKTILIRIIAILIGLILAGLICLIVFGVSPFKVYYELINGTFLLDGVFLTLVKDTMFLLGVSIALIPAFKMKFWNLGGNGQILMGAFATIVCMRTFAGNIPDPLLWVLMFASAIFAGILWAVIPAIFKACFNTNETLFTLMMNYIATNIVAYFVSQWENYKSETSTSITQGNLPVIAGSTYVLPIIIFAILTAVIYFYMHHSKHGYEISIVGESQNTAKYAGINVKKVIIRTIALSGAICGVVGLLFVSTDLYTINATYCARNLGFTAIIAVWIANNHPLIAIASTFGITFLTQGMGQAQTILGTNDASIPTLIVGLMFFFIIGCEFFANYIIKKRNSSNTETNAKEEIK